MARYFIFVFISCCLILVEAGVRERRSPQFSQASASASATAFGGNGYHPPGYGGYGPGYGGGNFGSGFGRPVGIGGGSYHGGFGNSGYGSGYSGRRFGNQGFGNPGFGYGHGPPLSFGQGQLPSINIAKSVSIGGTSLSSANSGG